MATEAIGYIGNLIKDGRKVGIFSCEDPYNTPFHRDILKQTDYVHLIPKAGGVVIPESLDLGLQAKGINAWGVFGHCGVVNGHEVCAAIKALNNGYHKYGPDLKRHIGNLSKYYHYQQEKTLKENIAWIETQYNLLLTTLQQKQNIFYKTVQGNIIIFGGLVENSGDGKSYKAKILFSNQKWQ